MRINIEYDSCWQTGFLGDDVKKPISKINRSCNFHAAKGYLQKFIATTQTKGERVTQITNNTVLGVLCRLIGDQRKLYQSKESKDFYFADIVDQINFEIQEGVKNTTQELMYLTNKSEDRCAQSNFLGVLKNDNPWFFSDNSVKFWSILFLDKEQLIDYILQDKSISDVKVDCSPKSLIRRINQLTNSKEDEGSVIKSKAKLITEVNLEIEKKEKLILSFTMRIKEKPPKTIKQKEKQNDKLNILNDDLLNLRNKLTSINEDIIIKKNDELLQKSISLLSNKFDNAKYLSNEVVYPMSLYAASLYLQAERLISEGVNLDFVKNTKGDISIQGFSKRGFNGIRDWLNRMTGSRKKAVGTPCIVQKQSGRLSILIDVDKKRGEEIKKMIKDAGVSSFYLGKKGLAYVSQISTKEVVK